MILGGLFLQKKDPTTGKTRVGDNDWKGNQSSSSSCTISTSSIEIIS